MIRGTTAQFQFNLPYQCCDLSLIKVTFWQSNNNGPSDDRPLPIVKFIRDLSGDSKVITVKLSEDETLRFLDKYKAYVQLRGKTIEGSVFASKPQMITVYPLYDNAILVDDTTTEEQGG